jgi:hypothetical protein
MSPPVSEEPPRVHADALHNPRYATELHTFSGTRITRFLEEQEEAWQRFRR